MLERWVGRIPRWESRIEVLGGYELAGLRDLIGGFWSLSGNLKPKRLFLRSFCWVCRRDITFSELGFEENSDLNDFFLCGVFRTEHYNFFPSWVVEENWNRNGFFLLRLFEGLKKNSGSSRPSIITLSEVGFEGNWIIGSTFSREFLWGFSGGTY